MAVSMMLGGVPLRANPNEVRWTFKMKVTDTKTIGGKVVQVLGVTLGDLTVTGFFGNGLKDKGDTEGWQNEQRFQHQVKQWAETALNNSNRTPLHFTYSPQNWDFHVFIKSLTPVHAENTNFNPQWQMVLFPVDRRATEVVKGIKDLYIARLMDGIGWKQTQYNGPSGPEVQDMLAGLSIQDFIEKGYGDSYLGIDDGHSYTGTSTGGTTSSESQGSTDQSGTGSTSDTPKSTTKGTQPGQQPKNPQPGHMGQPPASPAPAGGG